MKPTQNGYSLIELLIAIAISMVAMVAVTEVYVSSKATSRVQEMQSRLSQDGRFGTLMMQRIISQAGYSDTPSNGVAADRISVTSNAITVKFQTDGANQMVCDGSTPAAASQTLLIQKSGSKLVCGAVDWIAPATSGTGNGTELVDFSVKLGIDTGPSGTNENLGCGTAVASLKPRDCIADSYVSTLPGTATAEQIVSLKVCWILRSEATDASIVKGASATDCSNAAIANSQNDHKLYRTFSTTVLLRNR
jgi:type IV pilus assembly protein PilW